MDFYSSFNADLLARQGLQPTVGLALAYLVWKPLDRFVRRYLLKGGFLDGWAGFIVTAISSIDFAFRFFKLWDRTAHPGRAPTQAPGPE